MEDAKEMLTSALKSDVGNFTLHFPRGSGKNVSSKLKYNKSIGKMAAFILIS